MEFQITMDPFMDFIFRMFIIGANIVVWTIIWMWLVTEVKSWFEKEDEESTEIVAHNPDFDPAVMQAYATKDVELTQRLFENNPPDLSMTKPAHKLTKDEAKLLAAEELEGTGLPNGITVQAGLGRPVDLMSVDQLAAYSPKSDEPEFTKPSYVVQWSKYGSFVFDDDDLQSELTQDTNGAVHRLINDFGDGYIRWQFTTDSENSWVSNGFVTKELLEISKQKESNNA